MRQQMMMRCPACTSNEQDGYAPSYYPGTPNMGEAARVAVKGGQELTGMNFALVAARLARVKGRVTNAAGEPAASVMIMVSSSDPSTSMMNMMMSGAQTRGDGTFQLSGVAAGQVHAHRTADDEPDGRRGRAGTRDAGQRRPRQRADRDVEGRGRARHRHDRRRHGASDQAAAGAAVRAVDGSQSRLQHRRHATVGQRGLDLRVFGTRRPATPACLAHRVWRLEPQERAVARSGRHRHAR